jgi:hypothetical protein
VTAREMVGELVGSNYDVDIVELGARKVREEMRGVGGGVCEELRNARNYELLVGDVKMAKEEDITRKFRARNG